MVKIETEHGIFEADSIREAEKLANKAAREAAKIAKQKEPLREMARLRAKAKAWDIVSRRLRGEDMPRGWILHPPGDKFSPTKIIPGDHGRVCKLAIETADGTGEWDGYGMRLDGTVENGAGFTLCVILTDRDNPSNTAVYAVGVAGGETALEELWEYSAADFAKEETTAA